MFELMITGGIIAGAALLVSRRSTNTTGVLAGAYASDLPCPWCAADTAESDRRCPGCGQTFG